MRIIGLTGGIASGKSTVSKELMIKGLPVVDADKIAHAVLAKNTRGWKKVVCIFGQEILLENGNINRAKLGEIVFSDASKRLTLNRALSSYIASGIFWEIFNLWIRGSNIIVLDVPLLFEKNLNWLTKPIVVVWVDPTTHLQRLMARDGISEELALNKIQSQMSLDLKREKADIVIDNTGSMDSTKEQIAQIYQQITRPLSWKEYMRSRNGVFLLFSMIGTMVLAWMIV